MRPGRAVASLVAIGMVLAPRGKDRVRGGGGRRLQCDLECPSGCAWAVGDMCRLLEAIRRLSTQLPCQWPVKGATARVTTRQSPAVVFSRRHG